MTKTENKNLNN